MAGASLIGQRPLIAKLEFNMMSDEDAYDQVEEMQVLESIYGDNIIQYIQGTKSLQLSFHKHHRLCIHIPNDYPSITSPILEFIHTPFTDLEKKQMIIYLVII